MNDVTHWGWGGGGRGVTYFCEARYKFVSKKPFGMIWGVRVGVNFLSNCMTYYVLTIETGSTIGKTSFG